MRGFFIEVSVDGQNYGQRPRRRAERAETVSNVRDRLRHASAASVASRNAEQCLRKNQIETDRGRQRQTETGSDRQRQPATGTRRLGEGSVDNETWTRRRGHGSFGNEAWTMELRQFNVGSEDVKTPRR